MTVKINSKHLVYQVDAFKLVEENITLDNGITTDVHILRHPGSAAIIPITEDDTIIMIRQYRHSIGGMIWEIPAGTRHSDEKPIDCAKRELREETGYTGQVWHNIGEVALAPGYSDESLHLFIAEHLEPSVQNLDKDEVLEVREIKFHEAVKMVYSGKIKDVKTICGLVMADHWLAHTQTERHVK